MQKETKNAKNTRTLTDLLTLDRRVYLYICNKGVWENFCKQAEKEGFLWSNGKKVRRVEFDSIVAMNGDMTFNYVGYIGRIRFNNANDDSVCKIDFARYINGADDYLIN